MKKILITIILFLNSIICNASDVYVQKIKIVNYGIFKENRINSERPTNEKENIIEDILVETSSTHLETTDIIKSEIGQIFGIHFQIVGKPELRKIEIEVIHEHPTIIAPSNAPINRQNYFVQRETGKTHQALFYIGKDWEVVEGDWVIKIKYNNKIYIEQKFELVK